MIELIVFDWDGTLMDSEASIVGAMAAAYREFGLSPPPAGAIRHIIGLSLEHAIARLSPELDRRSQHAIGAAYRRHYAAAPGTPRLFPGVRETLAELVRRGFYLAVATGKSRAGLARALDETGLAEHFVATRTADESEPKPSPVMLQEILTDLDVEAAAACMLGDTEYDLAMARAAGVHPAAVSYGAHAEALLMRHEPVFVLDTFGDLPDRLARFVAAP